MTRKATKHYELYGSATNAETGEVVPVVVAKTVNQGPLQFALVDRRALFDLILSLDGSSKDVLAVILRDMRDYTNVYNGTYKKIEERTGLSAASVKRGMKDLQDRNIIRMISNGKWLFNPAYCWTVDTDRQRGLQYWYDGLESAADRAERKNKRKRSDMDVLQSAAASVEARTGAGDDSDVRS